MSYVTSKVFPLNPSSQHYQLRGNPPIFQRAESSTTSTHVPTDSWIIRQPFNQALNVTTKRSTYLTTSFKSNFKTAYLPSFYPPSNLKFIISNINQQDILRTT